MLLQALLRRPRALAAGLFAVTVAVFLPALANGFVDMDDGTYVLRNPHVLRGLSWQGFSWAFTDGRTGNWTPLAWLSHMLDVSLWGTAPAGHHLTSVLLHGATAALLFSALHRATGAPGRSLLASALFALHPLRVESVAWVSERKDVLCAFFSAAMLLQYVRYRARPAGTSYLGVLALYACALMAKSMAVTLPFALLLLDLWPLGPGAGWRPRVREKLPMLAMAAAVSGLTVALQRAAGAVQPLVQLSWAARLAQAPHAYARTLGLTVWPRGLHLPYLRAPVPVWLTAVELALLVGLLCASFALRRSRPPLFVGFAWYLGVMLPTVGLVQVGPQLTADRYTYLPHAGLFLALAFALGWGRRGQGPRGAVSRPEGLAGACLQPEAPVRGSPPWAAAVSAAAVGALCLGTLHQLRYWQSSDALFTHTLAVDPENDWAEVSLALVRLKQHRAEEAEGLIERALARRPGDGFTESCHAAALLALGRPQAALVAAQRAATLSPADGVVQHVLGRALLGAGRPAEALAPLALARRLEPEDPGVAETWVAALGTTGHAKEALAESDRGLSLFPGDAALWMNRGVSLANLGRLPEAESSLAHALVLDPSYPGLAGLLSRVREDMRASARRP